MTKNTFNSKDFSKAFDSVSEGLALISHSGQATWFNNAFLSLSQLSETECRKYDFSFVLAKSTASNPFSRQNIHFQYIPFDTGSEQAGILILKNKVDHTDYARPLNAPATGIGLLRKHTDNKKERVASCTLAIATQELLCTEGFYSLLELPPNKPASVEDFLARVAIPDKQSMEDYIRQGYKNHSAYEIETHISLPSGASFRAWVTAGVETPEETGRPRLMVTIVDISAIKAAEPELIKAYKRLSDSNAELQRRNKELETIIQKRTRDLELSDDRFRLLSKATNEIAWDWDCLDNKLVFNELFNEEFASKVFPPENGLEYWQSRIHPEDKEVVVNDLLKSIQDPAIQSWKAEYRLLSNQGHYELILDRGYIIRDERGQPLRMVGSLLKLSDVKVVESKLRASEQMYQVLAESMPQLVYSINAKGQGDYFNLRWLDYTGNLPKKMTEDMWSDIIFPDDLPGIREAWRRCNLTAEELSIELRLKNKTGAYRWFLTRAIPIVDSNDCIVRWVGTLTDIHDQKTMLENLEKAEQQLSQDLSKLNFTNQHLAKVNKELDNFIHIASHDLRNPIRNMESLLNMMRNEIKPYLENDNLREIFSLVQKSNKVLKNLVLDLTEIPVSDQEEEAPGLIDLEEIVNEVLISIGDLIIENEPDLRVNLQIKKLRIRPKEIRSILFNLINNAIKYRSEERRPIVEVSFEYSANKNHLTLKVADNGIGIATQDLNNVFVPFKRLHKASPGLGLGMSLVKQTIEKNGGSIEVYSELDKGTIFTITFPASLNQND